MFPWLIWLCMAGTAKGTVPSPLPSGDYIRLTGTSHFHRYYGAIRLPTTLLRPSFRCVHIPRFTRFHGRCRLSPVGIATVCSMNRSQTPPELPRTHLLYRSLPCCLPCTQTRRPLGIALSFDAQYYPYYLSPYALPSGCPLPAQGRFRWLGYCLSEPGFHRLVTLPFAGRTECQSF